jgi:hypothetical protein
MPPQSNLNTPGEMTEYNNRLENETPQCPLVVDQADEIDIRARRFFKRTGREMILSANERRIVREEPEASDRYYEAVGTHLVANGSMRASAPWKDEVCGSGSEKEADKARRREGHHRDKHGRRKRRDGRK